MKKFLFLAPVVALVVAALDLPALAQDRFSRDDNPRYEQRQPERFASFLDKYFYPGDDRWEDHDDFDKAGAPAVARESDQATVTGDGDQSLTATSDGNSDQCVSVQGVVNTGNTQNQASVVQSGSEADDFSSEDSGSTIIVSPNLVERCDQGVNQAASAYRGW